MIYRKFKFTKASVEKISFSDKGQVIYWDTELVGFGVYAYPKSRSYFVQGRVNGKTVKSKIGSTSVISLNDRPDPENAGQKRLGARSLAKLILAAMAQGINRNEDRRAEKLKKLSFQDVSDRFFDARSLKPNTVTSYKKLIRLYLNDWLDKPIGSITKDMVARRHARIGKEKGPSPANNVMRTFRSIYTFARVILEDEIPENPVQRLTSSKQWFKVERRQTSIKSSDLPKWFAAVNEVENPTSRAYLLLILFTGLRREEAASLCWDDIDFEEKSLTITQTKNGKPHTLPLSEFLYDMLLKRKKIEWDQDGSPYVFSGSGRKTGYISAPTKTMKAITEKTGVRFCLHDLRRTFISIAESLDISYASLKKLLNHSTSNDVTQGYLVISTERLREPMEKISRGILRMAQLSVSERKVLPFPQGQVERSNG